MLEHQYYKLFYLCCLMLMQLFFGPVMADLPVDSAEKHLGVASCASSQCHGSIKGFAESDIRRNEYRTWSREDAHSKAYAVLKTKISKKMAIKLGLENAHEAKICLDCHTDNVSEDKRGKKFQLADGVGCEACHGGSEKWIKSHTEKDVDHKDNIQNGLYPLEDPEQRAKLCLSCHLGNSNKYATHEVMAAGHPRLSFELDSFTLIQTHYDIDDDYLRRKEFPGNVDTWAVGIAQTALQYLETIRSQGFRSAGVFPELALFDCHACHHAMSDPRLGRRLTTSKLPAGTIRFNDSSLIILYIISKQISPAQSEELLMRIRLLHSSILNGKVSINKRVTDLDDTVKTINSSIISHEFSTTDIISIRRSILKLGSVGEFRDYSGAEQATMAVDLLTFALGEEQKYKKQVNSLFAALENESAYKPTAYSRAAKAMLADSN